MAMNADSLKTCGKFQGCRCPSLYKRHCAVVLLQIHLSIGREQFFQTSLYSLSLMQIRIWHHLAYMPQA